MSADHCYCDVDNIYPKVCAIKYKAVPLHPMKALGGDEDIAPTHS
jgi:hypothetical protein